jgi:hypothetical protein
VSEIWSLVIAFQAGGFSTRHVVGFRLNDADAKLIRSQLVGALNAHAAEHFIGDVALRLANRVQLIADGH